MANENRKGLKKCLEELGFTVSENNPNVIAFRKSYHIDQIEDETGAIKREMWTDDYETIVRPANFGFRIELKDHNIIFIPFP